MTTETQHSSSISSFISTELFNRLVAQIVKNHNVDHDQAQRIMAGTIVFLKTCAANPGRQLRPSRAVDTGWHAFILNTADYAAFCQQVAGRFIHHQPDEFEPAVESSITLAPTVEAIQAAGFEADPAIWVTGSGDCSQCHAGCTDCGQRPLRRNVGA